MGHENSDSSDEEGELDEDDNGMYLFTGEVASSKEEPLPVAIEDDIRSIMYIFRADECMC